MFGSGETTEGKQPGPEWAQALADRLIGTHRRVRVWVKVQPKSRDCYGCAAIDERRIYLYLPTMEQTREALHVALHEIAHHIHPEREMYRGRESHHGPGFCNVACNLFADFWLLGDVATGKLWDYAGVRAEARRRVGLPAQVRRPRRKRLTLTPGGGDAPGLVIELVPAQR